MANLNILKTVSGTLHRVGFVLRKHAPEILIVTGAVGTVAGTVMACKATTKLGDVTAKAKADVDTIHEAAEVGHTVTGEEYSVADCKKDLAKVYVRTGFELVKLYGPSVAVSATSLGCMLTSHKIMRGRNMALAAAYATVDKSFKEYRGRLKERFGEELDKELRYNIKAKEVEETVVDEEGKETTTTKTVNVAEGPLHSEYAIIFDETCEGWTKNANANKKFLLDVERYANDKLQTQRHLFLNELYDMLGAQRTRAGNEVGWLYDPKGIECGDNYVDLGLFDQCGVERYDERKRAFVNGHERSVIIDPNVDGVILSRLP